MLNILSCTRPPFQTTSSTQKHYLIPNVKAEKNTYWSKVVTKYCLMWKFNFYCTGGSYCYYHFSKVECFAEQVEQYSSEKVATCPELRGQSNIQKQDPKQHAELLTHSQGSKHSPKQGPRQPSKKCYY